MLYFVYTEFVLKSTVVPFCAPVTQQEINLNMIPHSVKISILFVFTLIIGLSNGPTPHTPEGLGANSSCLAPMLSTVKNKIWTTPHELKIQDRPDTSSLYNFLLSCKFNARRWIRNAYNPDNKTFIIPVVMHKSTDLDTYTASIALAMELQSRFNEFEAMTHYEQNFIFVPVSRDPIYNDKIIGVLRMLNTFAKNPITPDMVVQLDDIRDLITPKFRHEQISSYTFKEIPKGIFPVNSKWGEFNIKGWIEPVNVIYADHHDDQGDQELMALKNIFNLDHHLPGGTALGKPNMIHTMNTYPTAIQTMGSCAGVFTSLFPVPGTPDSNDAYSRVIKNVPEMAYLLLAAMTIDSTAFTSQSVLQSSEINGKGYDEQLYEDLKNYFNANMNKYKGGKKLNPAYSFETKPANRSIKTPELFQSCIGKNGQAVLSPELQVNFDVKSTYFHVPTLVAQDNNGINSPENILGFSPVIMQKIIHIMAQAMCGIDLPPLEAIQIKGFDAEPAFDMDTQVKQELSVTGITAPPVADSALIPAIYCRLVTDELDTKTSQFIMMSHDNLLLDEAIIQLCSNCMMQKAAIKHFFVQTFTGPNVTAPLPIPSDTNIIKNTLMGKLGLLLAEDKNLTEKDRNFLFHIALEASKDIAASAAILAKAEDKPQAIDNIAKTVARHFTPDTLILFTQALLSNERGYTQQNGQTLQPELIVDNQTAQNICDSTTRGLAVKVIQLPTMLSRKTFLKILQHSPTFLRQLESSASQGAMQQAA